MDELSGGCVGTKGGDGIELAKGLNGGDGIEHSVESGLKKGLNGGDGIEHSVAPGFKRGLNVGQKVAFKKYGPNEVLTSINTFKDGFLSALAHDLEFSVMGFELEILENAQTGLSVRATFDPTSLKVVDCKEKDRREIESNTRDAVLRAAQFPVIRFESTRIEDEEGGFRLVGNLTLCGKTREINTLVLQEDDQWVANFEILQSDFGIAPFSTMGGLVRVKDMVGVRVQLPQAAPEEC